MSERSKKSTFNKVNNSFTIYVSLDYALTKEGEASFLEIFFDKVSDLLYTAVHQQQQISCISFGQNLEDADIDLSLLRSTITGQNRIWNSAKLIFSRNDLYSPGLMFHELAHYLYDLGDEYIDGYPECNKDPNGEACIMEFAGVDNITRWVKCNQSSEEYSVDKGNAFNVFWQDYIKTNTEEQIFQKQIGGVSQFCYDGNHDTQHEEKEEYYLTEQNWEHDRRSCWNILVDDELNADLRKGFIYNLDLPNFDQSEEYAQPAKKSNPPIAIKAKSAMKFVELIPEHKYILVCDLQFKKNSETLKQLEEAIHFWIDYVNPGEVLGCIGYTNSVQSIFPLTEVPEEKKKIQIWRDSLHEHIKQVFSKQGQLRKSRSKKNVLVDALELGRQEMTSRGLSYGQTLVLITDDNKNLSQKTVEGLAPNFIAAGIKIFTLGLGATHDSVHLTYLSSLTSGRYYSIDNRLMESANSFTLLDALIQLAGYSRMHSHTVAVRTTKTKSREKAFHGHATEVCFEVQIANKSTICTIGTHWQGLSNKHFEIHLYSPDHNLVVPSRGTRVVKSENSYCFFVIDRPMAGKWILRIRGRAIPINSLKPIAFEVNKHLNLKLTTLQSQVKAGEDINLRAFLSHQIPMSRVNINAIVRSPSGKESSFQFTEYEEEELKGHYYLKIQTDKSAKSALGQYLIRVEVHQKEVKKIGFNRSEFYLEDLIFVGVNRGEHKKFNLLPGANTIEPFVPDNQSDLLEKWKKRKI